MRYGLVFTFFTTLFTFNNQAMMIDEAHITTEQARRARERLDNRAEFVKARLEENALHKSDYYRLHPEKREETGRYEFY